MAGAYAAVDQPGLWGLTGPQFLGVFVGLMAASGLLTALISRWVRRSPRPSRDVAAVVARATPEMLGGLRSREGAVEAAVAQLLARGDLRIAPDGRVVIGHPGRPGPYDAWHTPVENAVLAAAAANVGPVPRRRELLNDAGVRQALDALHQHLLDQGCLVRPARARVARWGTVPMLLVLAVGLIRLVHGALHGRAVGYLVGLLILHGIGTALAWSFSSARTTRPADKAFDQVRRDNLYLVQSGTVPVGTHATMPNVPPARVPLAVGIFGAGAMFAAYPSVIGALGFSPNFAGLPGATDSSRESGSSTSGSSCGGGCGGCGG